MCGATQRAHRQKVEAVSAQSATPILATSLGQRRDCFGSFGEDSNRILKLPCRGWDGEKTGTSVRDPPETNVLFATNYDVEISTFGADA